jgi:y4mF family transcriptional regulator
MGRIIHSTADLGRAIRAERQKLGLTQGDLAAASGVSLRFISELERGRTTAGVGRVLRVLKMLGLAVVLESPGGAGDG